MKGYQLLASPVAPAEVLDVALYEERSRFIEVFEPVRLRDEDSVRGTAVEAMDLCDISFAAWHDSACPLVRQRGSDVAKVHRVPRDVKLFNNAVPALPQSLTAMARYVAIVTGAWRHPAVIHILEYRTTLLGLRRSAQILSHRDTLLLAIGDNLAEILFDEKGRCRDREANALVRQAAGLCAGSGIDLRRRHVETQRNSADRGSRMADRGLFLPGQRRGLPPDVSARRFAVATAQAARLSGLPLSEFPGPLPPAVPAASSPAAILASELRRVMSLLARRHMVCAPEAFLRRRACPSPLLPLPAAPPPAPAAPPAPTTKPAPAAPSGISTSPSTTLPLPDGLGSPRARRRTKAHASGETTTCPVCASPSAAATCRIGSPEMRYSQRPPWPVKY